MTENSRIAFIKLIELFAYILLHKCINLRVKKEREKGRICMCMYKQEEKEEEKEVDGTVSLPPDAGSQYVITCT